MWKGNPITKLHIELSNHCNAACPFCPRYLNSTRKVREDLDLNSITINQYKEWLTPQHLKDMKRILFCGTHGDPIMAKDFNEIIQYTCEQNPRIHNIIHTNGGARSIAFWQKLGELSKQYTHEGYYRSNVQLVFSIDGLEDTNHLYRRNVKWDKLMENAKAFIDAGGSAVWEFLVFDHNQHQVDEAKAMSEAMGFQEFKPKRPLGFEANHGLRARGVYDRDGKLEYRLLPAVNHMNHSDTITDETVDMKVEFSIPVAGRQQHKLESLKKRLAEHNDNETMYLTNVDGLNDMKIECKSMENKNDDIVGTEIYISANGVVFPCCYVGTRVDSDIDLYEDVQMRAKMRDEGYDKFRLTHHSLDDIIESQAMDHVFTDSWEKDTVQCGKMAYCAQTCGTDSEIDRIYKKASVGSCNIK